MSVQAHVFKYHIEVQNMPNRANQRAKICAGPTGHRALDTKLIAWPIYTILSIPS